jgi:glycine cleavage system H protein
VYVDVDTLDETVDKDEVFGSVEAVKTVSDLFMPLSGEVVEFNEGLEDDPEIVNKDPYDKGWIIKISITDQSQIEDLLDAQAYKSIIGG